MKLTVLTFLSFQLSAFAKVQIFPADTYEDCSDGGKAKYIDYSGLEYDYSSDFEYTLTGDLKFPGGLKSPVNYEIFLEKFERGGWHKHVLDRKGKIH
jgi:hypothetical protein